MRRIADHIETAWNLYKENFVSFLLAMFVVALITLGTVAAGILALFASGDADASLGTQEEVAQYISTLDPSIVVLSSILFLLAVIFNIALTGGVIGFVRDLLDGQEVDAVRDVVRVAKDKGLSLVWGRAITVLILGLIAFAFFGFLPGSGTFSTIFAAAGAIIFVAAIVSFILVEEAIVVSDTTGIQGVSKSYKTAINHFWPLFTIMLFFGLAGFVFNLLPYIGMLLNLFFLTPIMLATYTHFYIEREGVTRAQQKAMYRSGDAFERTKEKMSSRHTSSKVSRRPLTEVKGIGEATEEKLRDANVKTTQSLVSSDPEKLSDKTGISQDRIEKWQKRARKL